MLIEFTALHPDKGQRKHVRPEDGRVLVLLKQAIEIKDSNALEPAPANSGARSTVAPWFDKPTWSVGRLPNAEEVCIVLRRGSENIFFSGEPGRQWNCPKDIVREFEKQKKRKDPDAQFLATERAKADTLRSMQSR